jgi:5'(3')-deoxyribonucleotidase
MRKRKRILVDMDETICDYRTKHSQGVAAGLEFPQAQVGFFYSLDPIEDAISTVKWLAEHHDVWIATAPSVRNSHCYSEKRDWIEKYFGLDMVRKTIICPDKSLLIADYLIDDKADGFGQENFTGELLQFGSSSFPDWDAIRWYFEMRLNYEPC